MASPPSTTGQPVGDFTWLINGFTQRVPGVVHTTVVSADGLLLASSEHLPRDSADQLAAVVSGLVSVIKGAVRVLDGQDVRQTVVEMGRGYLMVMSIRDGSILASLAGHEADVGVVGYEMAKLAKQAGDVLTPALRDQLRQILPAPSAGS